MHLRTPPFPPSPPFLSLEGKNIEPLGCVLCHFIRWDGFLIVLVSIFGLGQWHRSELWWHNIVITNYETNVLLKKYCDVAKLVIIYKII
jgi:hypothetical protein